MKGHLHTSEKGYVMFDYEEIAALGQALGRMSFTVDSTAEDVAVVAEFSATTTNVIKRAKEQGYRSVKDIEVPEANVRTALEEPDLEVNWT